MGSLFGSASKERMSFMKQVFALVSFLIASASSADLVAFDCFRESDLSTSGIIPFYGCNVDLTTLDPWKGSFTASQSGLWRFTFQGAVQVGVGQGVVELRVNDAAVARSEVAPGVNAVTGLYQISLNDLVNVEEGDTVEIQWISSGDAGTHYPSFCLKSISIS